MDKIRHALLREGQIYRNRGGGEYLCARVVNRDAVRMVNIKSGWTLTAHVITWYCDDGSIEWDYSTQAGFGPVPDLRKEA